MSAVIEQILLSTLIELEKAVEALRPGNPKPDLPALFARVEELEKQLPRNTDPVLRHYLQKKSYEKARLFLQGRAAENRVGNCRRG